MEVLRSIEDVKMYTRKSKESVGGGQKSMGPSKRNHEDENGRINEPVCFITRHSHAIIVGKKPNFDKFPTSVNQSIS